MYDVGVGRKSHDAEQNFELDCIVNALASRDRDILNLLEPKSGQTHYARLGVNLAF